MHASDVLLCFVAIIFPPLPVWVKRGLCSADGLINLALCCLGVLPAMVHAIYIIVKYHDEQGDLEGGRERAHGRAGYAPVDQFPQQQNAPYQPQTYGSIAAPASSSATKAHPPSYAEVVARGDNKVQT